MTKPLAFTAKGLFDGSTILRNHALVIESNRCVAVTAQPKLPNHNAELIDLGSGIIVPGLVDLQVNGGGGVMFNAEPSVEGLKTVSQAHSKLGTTSLLPTIITDSSATMLRAIEASIQAVKQQVPGIVGLHLEGPFIDASRCGAHDHEYTRQMGEDDLTTLLKAAAELPTLMVTISPEAVSGEQISKLAANGVIVSLGHTSASYDTCAQAILCGATCATHLFNACEPLTARSPGLIGAALSHDCVNAGIIADGIHVHPANLEMAFRCKRDSRRLFLVSDAMPVVGGSTPTAKQDPAMSCEQIDQEDGASTVFTIQNRNVVQRGKSLYLADGSTLAGAAASLASGVQTLYEHTSATLEHALAAATTVPAQAINREDIGLFKRGSFADFVLLDQNLNVQSVWQRGVKLG